jgi:nucleotide-binding universal stress UspA family protein
MNKVMFKRIIVGFDGSGHARKALNIAGDLAKAHQASLVIVHAVSDSPLTKAERLMAETEYGMKGLEERPPVALIKSAETDPRLPFTVAPDLPADAAARVRTEFAQALLDDARRSAVRHGVESVELRVETGDPARIILELAKSEKADLIVIGSRGLSDLEGLVFGSTSHKVTHLAPCSCLTVS